MTRQNKTDNPFELTPGTILSNVTLDFPGQTDPSQRRQYYCKIIESLTGEGSYGFSYKGEVEGLSEKMFVFIKTPKIERDEPAFETHQRIGKIYTSFLLEYQTRYILQNIPSGGVTRIIGFGSHEIFVGDERLPVLLPVLVQEFIDGTPLETHFCEKSEAQGIVFRGIKNPKDWFDVARKIVKVVARVHNQQIVHGDIGPRNILMKDNDPILVDFGQSFSLNSQHRQDKLSSKNAYRAPECATGTIAWDTPADIYALGGVLYFLATGTHPFSCSPSESVESVKKTILDGVKKENPELLRQNEGIVKIIDKCMRPDPNDRYKLCEQILVALESFNQTLPVQKVISCVATVENANGEQEQINIPTNFNDDFFHAILAQNIRLLGNTADAMTRHHHEIFGDREEIIDSLIRYLSVLGKGDQYFTVTLPEYWLPNNLGINGRFLTMNKVMASRGVIIRRVFLLTKQDRENEETMQIIRAHLAANEDAKRAGIDVISKEIIEKPYDARSISLEKIRQYYTGFYEVTEEERIAYKKEGHHVALWQKTNGQMMSIIFFSSPTNSDMKGEQVLKVRFSSATAQRGTRDQIANMIRLSKPLEDYFKENSKPEPTEKKRNI